MYSLLPYPRGADSCLSYLLSHSNCSITPPFVIVFPAAVGDGRLVVVTEGKKNTSLMGIWEQQENWEHFPTKILTSIILPTWETHDASRAVMDPSPIPNIFSPPHDLISCGVSFTSVHYWQLTLFAWGIFPPWWPTLLLCVVYDETRRN